MPWIVHFNTPCKSFHWLIRVKDSSRRRLDRPANAGPILIPPGCRPTSAFLPSEPLQRKSALELSDYAITKKQARPGAECPGAGFSQSQFRPAYYGRTVTQVPL